MPVTRITVSVALLALLGLGAAAEPARLEIKSIGVLYHVDAPFGQSAVSLSVVRSDGEGFAYETYSRGRGLARLVIASDALESTRFNLDAGERVQPLAYMCRSCDGKKDGLVEIAYDWEAKRAVYGDQKKQSEFALEPRTMDRKAWEIQTMLDLGAGRPLTVQSTLEEGKLKRYHGERLGEETLQTRAGELETVRYRRQREGSENFQYIWYARELGWLPARWEIWRKDKRTVIIEAYEFAWGEEAALAMRQDWLHP